MLYMVKIIGVLFVMFSGMSFGFLKAAKEQKKYEQGIAIKRLLYLLQGEIRYGFSPLPEAIKTISSKVANEFRPFLVQVSEELSSHEEESFSTVWSRGLEEKLQKVIIEKKFLEPLMAMGESIGYLDQEMQLKTIHLAIEQEEDLIYQMKEKVISNCKLYRSLGLSFSVLVIIVLI